MKQAQVLDSMGFLSAKLRGVGQERARWLYGKAHTIGMLFEPDGQRSIDKDEMHGPAPVSDAPTGIDVGMRSFFDQTS